jgi:signal transduction histidine kinase
VFLFLLAAGCQAPRINAEHVGPIVEFTGVPVAGAGDPKQVSAIKGRVLGAQPGQQIVLYAKGEEAWWVQPFANQPFTSIQSDSRWQNSTHPGSEYAALLVGPEFQPPPTTDELPGEGVFAFAIAHGEPELWRRWWFPFLCLAVGLLLVFSFHRLRLHQLTRTLNVRFEERLAERMRVAQELHDTLLQGVLSASMQLHVAVDQLPANSTAQKSLNRVLTLMGVVVEDGRNALRGLRSSGENPRDLERAFLRIRQGLGFGEQVDFRIIVEGSPLPLRATIHDDVYSVGREALVNAFRHSGATTIAVELVYAVNQMRIVVRDNGCGIDKHVLQAGRDGHFGLTGMQERAKRIGARLKVWSRADAGTEVELSIPSHVAFESHPTRPTVKWLTKLYTRKAKAGIPTIEPE